MRVTIWISVAYAFAQREYAFEGISEEDIDSSTLSGAIHSVHNHSLREFIEQFPYLGKRELGNSNRTRYSVQESPSNYCNAYGRFTRSCMYSRLC